MCKSKLDYLTGSETIWRCNECMEYYDLRIQDSPIKDTTDFKLIPYSDLQHYPTSDENDPNMLFMEGIDLNNKSGSEIELIRSSDDKRIQHIYVKGSPAEALSAMNKLDYKA